MKAVMIGAAIVLCAIVWKYYSDTNLRIKQMGG